MKVDIAHFATGHVVAMRLPGSLMVLCLLLCIGTPLGQESKFGSSSPSVFIDRREAANNNTILSLPQETEKGAPHAMKVPAKAVTKPLLFPTLKPQPLKVATKPSPQSKVSKAIQSKISKPVAKVTAPKQRITKQTRTVHLAEQAPPKSANTQLHARPVKKIQVVKQVVSQGDRAQFRALRDVGNASVGTNASSSTVENKTKVVDAVVASLPMASFALDAPAVTNKTKTQTPKLARHGTQKAAFKKMKKAQDRSRQPVGIKAPHGKTPWKKMKNAQEPKGIKPAKKDARQKRDKAHDGVTLGHVTPAKQAGHAVHDSDRSNNLRSHKNLAVRGPAKNNRAHNLEKKNKML